MTPPRWTSADVLMVDEWVGADDSDYRNIFVIDGEGVAIAGVTDVHPVRQLVRCFVYADGGGPPLLTAEGDNFMREEHEIAGLRVLLRPSENPTRWRYRVPGCWVDVAVHP